MKNFKLYRYFVILSAILISACSTPVSVRQGAKFSSVEIGILKTELQKYAKLTNDNIEQRRARLISRFKNRLRLERAIEDNLYIAIGNFDPLNNELSKIAKRFQKREKDFILLIDPETERLKALTTPIKFPSQSITDAQVALAKLSDEETSTEQLNFFISYILDVQNNIEIRRAEEERKEQQ